MSFSEILRDLLSEINLNQTEFAKILNVKQSQVSEWLKGKANPGYDTLKIMATKLNISSECLLGLEDDFGTPTAGAMHDTLTREERELIEKYRGLNAPGKKLVKTVIDTQLATMAESKQHNTISLEK